MIMKKVPFPKIPTIEAYLSGDELRGIMKNLDDTNLKSLVRLRVKVGVGYHDLIPAMKSSIRYLERCDKYEDYQNKLDMNKKRGGSIHG